VLENLTFKTVLLAAPHNFVYHIINFINVRVFYDSDQLSNLYSMAYAYFTASGLLVQEIQLTTISLIRNNFNQQATRILHQELEFFCASELKD